MKTILCALLFAAFASPTYSQQADSVKIWITPEQEARVFGDRKELHRLQLGYKIVTAENTALWGINASLLKSLDSLTLKVEELNRKMEGTRAEFNKMNKLLEYADLRTKGYQAIAYQKTIEAQKGKKWQGRYYTMASLRIGEMILVNAIFTWVIIYFTNNI